MVAERGAHGAARACSGRARRASALEAHQPSRLPGRGVVASAGWHAAAERVRNHERPHIEQRDLIACEARLQDEQLSEPQQLGRARACARGRVRGSPATMGPLPLSPEKALVRWVAREQRARESERRGRAVAAAVARVHVSPAHEELAHARWR
eukprot:CAMPEP_0179878768 /NCGR_PEP_ID=MMETSP0982-20121206/25621_1 /TAXON_ID=483367 /ORGANISM="non described non described, Strain CCMP 2436" /LENGTH=152 /DNA_ID=CAMNT_0021771699 /DNA_START=111 /DNA_END=566 /DNA_ORIENTATION=-